MLTGVFFATFFGILVCCATYVWFFTDPNTYFGDLCHPEDLLRIKPCGRPVPHQLYQIWFPFKEGAKPAEHEAELTARTRALHPGWGYERLDSVDACRAIVSDVAPQLLPKWDGWSAISRNDATRYALMYQRGGVYMDGDMWACRSLDRYLPDGYAMLGYQRRNVWKKGAVCNAFMAAPPEHPFFKHCLKRLLTHAPGGGNPVDVAGPNFLTQCVSTYTGEDLLVLPMPLIYPKHWSERHTIDDPMPMVALTATTFHGEWV